MSRVLLPALLAPVLAASLLVGGCADDDRPASSSTSANGERDGQRDSPEAEPSQPAPASQDPGDETDQGSPEPHKVGRLGTPVARAHGARGHLLAADRMPAAGGAVVWTVAETRLEDGEQTGACQKTSLVDLGAVRAVRRDYAGDDDSTFRARQVVARFADARSAWRASEVLASWRADCAERLDYPRTEVGDMEEIATEPGSGGRYPLTYGTRRSLEAAELGIVRKGRWLALIEIAADRESFPEDRRPARRAVRTIAATFA